MRKSLLLLTAVVQVTAKILHNVSYAGDSCDDCPSCTCMDVWLPTARSTLAAFILFFHGGLWYSGSRTEINEVCAAVLDLSKGTVGCATADYRYSQDLGGSCAAGGAPTYASQAKQAMEALSALRMRPEVDESRVLLGGHSAGGHLAAWLSVNWPTADGAEAEETGEAAEAAEVVEAPPLAFAGVEGIYNASVWDAYQAVRWKGGFHCADWQSFGDPGMHWKDGWIDGSPTAQAAGGVAPAGPVLLIHSKQDDYVQSAQAKQLFPLLRPPTSGAGAHRLDVSGACVQGEHPDVLKGTSATMLARCMLTFLDEAVHE